MEEGRGGGEEGGLEEESQAGGEEGEVAREREGGVEGDRGEKP